MTYQHDPKANRPLNRGWDANSYTAWIVGGAVVVALILGVFMLTGPSQTPNSVATEADRPQATAPAAPAPMAPSTTGSAPKGSATPPASVPR